MYAWSWLSSVHILQLILVQGHNLCQREIQWVGLASKGPILKTTTKTFFGQIGVGGVGGGAAGGPKGPQPSVGARRKGMECPELLVLYIKLLYIMFLCSILGHLLFVHIYIY